MRRHEIHLEIDSLYNIIALMPSSTWKNRNIFEDVLNREDSLTDALRNFLKYPPVQDALRQTLPENVRERINFSSIEAIETRPSDNHRLGMPDLVFYGSDFILVIEVKIGAELTKAQQEVYIPWLREAIRNAQKEMGFVVFLIPDEYSYRSQLDSCLERARKKLCRSNNSKIQVFDPTTWQKFVTKFESQNMSSLNELIREFYDYLYEKFEPVRFFTEEVRLMHSNEMASGIRGIRKLIKIVDKVNPQLRLRNPSQDSSGYGYNFSDPKRKKFVWFGIWWEYWAKKGFPLCIAVSEEHRSSILNAFKKQSKFVDFTDEHNQEWLVIEYKPGPDTDCSELIGDIVTDIETLLREDGSEESSEDAETS